MSQRREQGCAQWLPPAACARGGELLAGASLAVLAEPPPGGRQGAGGSDAAHPPNPSHHRWLIRSGCKPRDRASVGVGVPLLKAGLSLIVAVGAAGDPRKSHGIPAALCLARVSPSQQSR